MNATIKRALSMILVLTTLVSTLGSAVSANGIFDEALPITAPLRSTTINTAELLDEASNSSIITTDTLDLLIRISDFNNFTPIEKNRVRNFVNLALGYYYEDDIALLTKLEDALASLGDYAKYEIQLQQLQYEYGSYTNCRADALKLLSEYLEITNPSALDAYMVTLQRSGYSLFDSMLLVEIADNGVFSLDEAQAIYERFPIRADRDYRVISFKDFALNFSYDRSDSLTALPSSITSSEQILSAAAYTNNTALNQAKALFMQGYDTDIIRSAFSVALLLGCEPAEVIASEHSLSSIDAANEYRYLMPSNYNKVSALMAEKSADVLTAVNQYAASAVGSNATLTEAQFYTAAQNVRDTVYPSLLTTTSITAQGNYTEFITPPFKNDLSEKETLDVNTGNIIYKEPILSLPGFSELNIDLAIAYSSKDAYTKQPGVVATGTYQYQLTYLVTLYIEGTTTKYSEYSNTETYSTMDQVTARINTLNAQQGAQQLVPSPWAGQYYLCNIYYSNWTTNQILLNGTYYNTVSEYTHNEIMYNIGTGWGFDLPSLEIRNNQKILHVPDMGEYQIIQESYGNTIYNYPFIDLIFEDSTAFSNGTQQSAYRLRMINGTCHYFASNGQLIGTQDRFGNWIRYIYTLVDGFNALSGITDSNGRTVSIQYVITSSSKTVNIIAPDNSVTQLVLTALTGEDVNNYRLDRIVYPDGTSTSFAYTTTLSYFDYLSKNVPSSFMVKNYMLTAVTYHTGAVLQYSYISRYENMCATGYIQRYSLASRTYRAGNETIISENYSYDSPFTNYPSTTDILPTGYTYSNTVTGLNNEKTVYTFNNMNYLAAKDVYYSNTLKYKTVYTYDTYNLPTTITNTVYDGLYSTSTVDTYTYDPFKHVLTHMTSKGEGSNNDYTETFVYEAYYGQLKAHYYKFNSTTFKLIVHDISSDNLVQTTYSISEALANTDGTPGNGAIKYMEFYEYDSCGRLSLKTSYNNIMTDWDGNAVQYLYDIMGNLSSIITKPLTDADGNTASNITNSYTYDSMGRELSHTDGNGNLTSTSYDNMGRVNSITAPNNGTVTYQYNTAANTVTYTEFGKTPIVYSYDAFGRLTSTAYSDAALTPLAQYTYNNRGQVLTETAGSQSVTTNTYDDIGRLTGTSIKDLAGNVVYSESYAYNDATQNTSTVTKTVLGGTGSAASTHVDTYNKHGELISINYNGRPQSYTYDYIGRKLTTTETISGTNYVIETLAYDVMDNVVSRTNSLGKTATASYNNNNMIATETDAKGNTTTYTYDHAARLIKVTSPFNGTVMTSTLYYYDGNGNIIKQKQSNHADVSTTETWTTTEYAYDSMNNNTDIAVQVNAGNTIYSHNSYNTDRSLSAVVSGLTQPYTALLNTDAYPTVTYTYDARGNQTAVTDALEQSEHYTYDLLGNPISKRDRSGTYTTYTYNALGKVASERVYASQTDTTPASTVTYTYAMNGELYQVNDNGATVTYTYDGAGNVISETESSGFTKQYGYSNRGERMAYTLRQNSTTITTGNYMYDLEGRMSAYAEGNVLIYYTYDDNGNRLTAENSTTGVTTTYTYNNANLVTSFSNAKSGTVLSSGTYAYNTDGNQRQKTELGVTTTYTYDGAGRLTSESSTNGNITYGYDARSNRTSMTRGSTTTTYAYDLNNRLLSETTGTTVKNYTYDVDGNTLTAGNESYTYDVRNRQIGYSDETTTASYAYNPKGLRSQKTVGGATKYFVWDGMNIVYEYDASAGTAYYYGLHRVSAGNSQYYLYNAHGDVVQLTDGTGAVTKSYAYDAFGNEVNPSASDTNPFRYCGEYYDVETGTIYLRARYYDPTTGRFTQQDEWVYANPGDPLSLNLYTYCWNNPIMFVDIMGNWPTWSQLGKAALIAVGATISVVAIVATAGTAAAAIGTGVAMYVGATATTAATITTVATVGAYGVATGVGAVAASDIGEVLTGHNVIRDNLLEGNQHVYNTSKIALSIAGSAIVQIGLSNQSSANNKSKTSDTLVFGSDVKSSQKLYNQMQRRGWSIQSVRNTVDNPYTTRISTNKATGNSATVFYNKNGSYVIVDDITKAIVQISDNINPSAWLPDSNIINPYRPR